MAATVHICKLSTYDACVSDLFLFMMFFLGYVYLLLFQAYQAHFHINYFLTVGPPLSDPGSSSSVENRAKLIADIAFMALFDDTKMLVSEGVRRDMARRILEASSPEVKTLEISRAKTREKHLNQWLAMDTPLTYGPSGSAGPFHTLLQAVVSADKDIEGGLPNWQSNAMSPADFVALLVNMSSPSSPAPLSAPVLKDGSFLPLLKEAHRALLSLCQHTTPSNQRVYVSNHFSRAVVRLKIHFVPFHLPQSGTRGAPRRKTVYNSWIQLGRRESRTDLPLPPYQPLLSLSQQAVAAAHSNALATDSNADWYAKRISLVDLHTILHYIRLPSDFASISGGKAKYVGDTYSWVRDAYDGTKPAHHLALIVGIVASCLLPSLFLPTDPELKARFAEAATVSEVRAIYGSIPWVSREKKGMKDPSIFVTMFTTFIIALYEPNSPLRQHMASSARKGLGNPWTDKHCVYPNVFLCVLIHAWFLS